MVNSTRLKRRFQQLPIAVKREIFAETEAGAESIATMTRTLAPKKRGKLAETVRVEPLGSAGLSIGAGGARGKFGHKVVYGDDTTMVPIRKGGPLFQLAKLQEFGTKNMTANPALFPSFRANRSRILRRIKAAMKRGARKV